MIKSGLKGKSELLKFLLDPMSVSKDLEKLEAKEKSVRELLKELYDGKSKKKFLGNLELDITSAQDRLMEAEAQCTKTLLEANGIVERRFIEVEKQEALSDEAAQRMREGEEAARVGKEEVKLVLAQVKKDLKVAALEKEKYLALKDEWETKVKDLRERLKGLG